VADDATDGTGDEPGVVPPTVGMGASTYADAVLVMVMVTVAVARPDWGLQAGGVPLHGVKVNVTEAVWAAGGHGRVTLPGKS
jgi:hypothetical protein